MLTREGEQVLDACLARLSAFETSLRQKVGASALDSAIETLRRANEAALEIHST
jgi:hypothetical protein